MTEFTALQRKIESLLAGFPCEAAVLAARFNSDGSFSLPTAAMTLCSLRAEERVVSASMIKVPILLAALSLCDAGKMSLNQPVSLAKADILPDTEVFEEENRQECYLLRELLYWMIVESDNTATNRLLDLLGFVNINRFCQRWGLEQTEIQRKMLDWDAIRAGKNNYTSLVDQYRLYAALLGGRLLRPDTRALALKILIEQRDKSGLLRYLPENIPFAHKTGCLNYLMHDAGVFLGEPPLFVGIFTWNGPSLEGDSRQLRQIGRLGKLICQAAYPNETTEQEKPCRQL